MWSSLGSSQERPSMASVLEAQKKLPKDEDDVFSRRDGDGNVTNMLLQIGGYVLLSI